MQHTTHTTHHGTPAQYTAHSVDSSPPPCSAPSLFGVRIVVSGGLGGGEETPVGGVHGRVRFQYSPVRHTRLHDARLVEKEDAIHRTHHRAGEGGHERFAVRVGLRPNRLPPHLLVVGRVEAVFTREERTGINRSQMSNVKCERENFTLDIVWNIVWNID